MEKDLGWCSRSWSERYKVCSSNSEQFMSPMQQSDHLLLNTLFVIPLVCNQSLNNIIANISLVSMFFVITIGSKLDCAVT